MVAVKHTRPVHSAVAATSCAAVVTRRQSEGRLDEVQRLFTDTRGEAVLVLDARRHGELVLRSMARVRFSVRFSVRVAVGVAVGAAVGGCHGGCRSGCR